MNGKARPGGIDGVIVPCSSGTALTLEPTNPGDLTVELWMSRGADEVSPSTRLDADALDLLADQLWSRAGVLRGYQLIEAEVLDAERDETTE